MCGFQLDSTKKGLTKFFKNYQKLVLEYVFQHGQDGVIARETWEYVKEKSVREKPISRASVVNFLNYLTEIGAIKYVERPGKGGYHRRYYPLMDYDGFKLDIVRKIIENLKTDFPDEYSKVVGSKDLQ